MTTTLTPTWRPNRNTLRFTNRFLDSFAQTLCSVLFNIPLIREIVLTLGGRKATKSVVEGMRVFGVVPGGVREMINQRTHVDNIYLRTGFLRMSYRKQLDIVPGYMFDETTVFEPVDNLPDFIVSIQNYVEKKIGVGLCIWRGRWNLLFNLIPKRGRYVTAIGRVLKFDDVKNLSEDDAIQLWLEKVKTELHRLFDEIKKKEQRRLNVEMKISLIESSRRNRTKKE